MFKLTGRNTRLSCVLIWLYPDKGKSDNPWITGPPYKITEQNRHEEPVIFDFSKMYWLVLQEHFCSGAYCENLCCKNTMSWYEKSFKNPLEKLGGEIYFIFHCDTQIYLQDIIFVCLPILNQTLLEIQ